MNQTALLSAIAFSASCAAYCSNASAEVASAQCELRIEGKTYVSGRCAVDSNPDGSFTMNVATPRRPTTYFAFVELNGDGTASASWNRDKGSLHAWKSLGPVVHEGDCWVGAKTRICVSKLRRKAHSAAP